MALKNLCEQCLGRDTAIEELLSEFAHMEERSLEVLRRMARYHTGRFFAEARERARRRLDGERRSADVDRKQLSDLREALSEQLLEQLMGGGDAGSLLESYLDDHDVRSAEGKTAAADMSHNPVETGDLRQVLDEYAGKGLLEEGREGVKITPKGSRRLARFILRRILESLESGPPGPNPTQEEGFGVSESYGVRPYEFGDEFCRIDQEATLMAALERRGVSGGSIPFDFSDLRTRETSFESRIVSGLIVDESGSMSGNKLHGAMDIALALSHLIGRSRRDSLRIFFFSDKVREIPWWDIANVRVSAGVTDARAALAHFRTKSRGEQGSRQVYLITDAEPNAENGKFVGFETAARGLLQEARRYRAEGITLNIVMLEEAPHLRQLASTLARENLGRAFFTTPGGLAGTVVQDYIRRASRRGRRIR